MALTTLTRRRWLGSVAFVVVLFLLANITGGSAKHPGTVSNIFWYAFLIGALALIVLGIPAFYRSRRSRAT